MCRRILASPAPDIEDVRQALTEIAEAGTRAGSIISHISAPVKNGAPQKSPVDMNLVIQEVLDIIPQVLENQHVSLEMELQSLSGP
jgi:C4-dicarboxylate-specific signal transduction histidine kinase